VLVLPLLGVRVVVAAWRSDLRVQRLSRRLVAEGGLPDVSGLLRRQSCRIDRAAADAWFDDRKAELEADPGDWRHWYRLACAYDIAARARATMRRALELEALEASEVVEPPGEQGR
jgi:hypothetical protein